MASARDTNNEARSGADKVGASEPPVASVSVGQALQTARLAKGLSASDVAKALKLSLRQVDALEADDWQSLPCNTIIRGFVRNYARLLGLDSDRLMAELDRLTLPPAAELEMSAGTPVSLPQEGRVDRRDFIRVFSGLIVLLLAVAAYYFLPQEVWLSTVSALKSATQSAAVKPVADAPSPAAVADAPANVANDAGTSAASDSAALTAPAANAVDAQAALPVAASPVADASPAANAASPAPTPVASAAPTVPGAAVLSFAFEQPSWVEVRDASGKVVYSKKNDAGTQRDVEGQPPFAVVIGNAGYVTLHYKGKKVDLSSRSKGDVARLTVE